MVSLIASILIFSLALSVKGGLLGRVFTNWNDLVKRIETNADNLLASIKLHWKNVDDAIFSDLIRAPFIFAAKWFMDGSIISAFIVLVYVAATQPDLNTALIFTLGYCLLFASMGEEAGAVGDYKGSWGDYVEALRPDGKPWFGRSYGIKKSIQYGIQAGAVMAGAVTAWPMLIAGALFPAAYFVGSSLYLKVTGQRSWAWSEPLWGLIFGVAYWLS